MKLGVASSAALKENDTMSERAALVMLIYALVSVIAILVATVAGYLARREGASYTQAVQQAARALAAFLSLAAAITTALASILQRL
ncbi:hypothetical protein ACFV42_09785 [Streptomyces solisilvae]|uniref:hypothetical protein n=1 Tax=Streptomyces malaysiensis TaxID=92644 RepID=UPI0036C8212A